jgi:hypothetical protein
VGPGFQPRDEGERARYAAYALYRRAAEAVTVRAFTDYLLNSSDLGSGTGVRQRLVVVGDLNDEPKAATTQILLGPPGSELGTPGANRPDKGDAARLWNLASLLDPAAGTRVYRGRPELIDHILVSRSLIDDLGDTDVWVGTPTEALPSITDNPTERRTHSGSDARKVGRTGTVSPMRRTRKNDEVDPAAVRAWAESNGIEVNARGRLRGEVVEQYRAAMA